MAKTLSRIRCGLGLAVLVGISGPVMAFEPVLHPTARQVVEDWSPDDAVRLPVTPWQAGEVQAIRAEGDIRRRVWQVQTAGLTTEQMLRPLRNSLGDAGYTILFECEARECGGFEFRFETDALPPPEMHVDLGDYRYLSAQADPGNGTSWIMIMTSRSANVGFIQVTEISPRGADRDVTATVASLDVQGADLEKALLAEGHAVLAGLAFQPGSSDLGPGPFEVLTELAAFLSSYADQRVVLVGHTDAQGALPGNIGLSRQRAASVRQRLIEEYGIAADRVSAEGVGFLSPLTTNDTEEGRERNRRVEVILDLAR